MASLDDPKNIRLTSRRSSKVIDKGVTVPSLNRLWQGRLHVVLSAIRRAFGTGLW